MARDDSLHEVLSKIAALANSAVNGGRQDDDPDDGGSADDTPGCVIKTLPSRLLVKAAEVAAKINPANAPGRAPMAGMAEGVEMPSPLELAVMTSKYWGPSPRTLSVSFLESTPANLRARIISHLNAWNKCCGIRFAATSGTGDVRISRGPGGYYSYLGTDVLLIPKAKQTMNLQGFTMTTPESEYLRVVRHEAGHTLGFPHEHARKAIVARIHPQKAYKWFWETYGWNKATVDAQVLTPLSEASLMGTPTDQTSIMCYILPKEITKDGLPILGGKDINATDCKFAGKIYPKPGGALGPAADQEADDEEAVAEEGWSEAEDVEVAV